METSKKLKSQKLKTTRELCMIDLCYSKLDLGHGKTASESPE